MSIWSNVWSSSEVSLLLFCVDELSTGDSGVFTITALASICAVRAIRVFYFLMYVGVPMFGACMLRFDIFS
jgi:hypothetical protein